MSTALSYPATRSRLAAAAALMLTLALAGCSGDGAGGTPANAEPVVEAPPDEAAPVEEPTQEVDSPPALPAALPKQTFTKTITSDGGYSQTLTVTLGPVVPSNQGDQIAAEWVSVGGMAEMNHPCIDVNPQNDMVTNYVMKAETAGFAFGTLSITNDVDGFDAAAVTYQFSRKGSSAMGMAFSDGDRCDGLNSGGFLFQPKAFSDTWGPVPVVVAIDNYRSPEHPDGDPAMLVDDPVKLLWTDLVMPLTAWTPTA